MNNISVSIKVPEGRPKEVELPLGTTVRVLLPELVARLITRPAFATDQAEFDYSLLTMEGRLLSYDETLSTAGVIDGDTLILHRDAVTKVWNLLEPYRLRENLKLFRPYVPDRFKQKIVVHIVTNFISEKLSAGGPYVPLLLGVQGPPGDGKSWQTRVICADLNVPVVHVSGASLSSEFEGKPQELLIHAYQHACKQGAVLLIDDFDTSPASVKDNARYTVNTQVLSGALMNLCDDPWHVGGKTLRRVPVVVTGNDFTALYQPLTRTGRMDFLSWSPTDQERSQIVKAIFYELTLTNDEAQSLAALKVAVDGRETAVPVSFFGEIKKQLLHRRVWQAIESALLPSARTLVETIDKGFINTPLQYTFQDLMEAGKDIRETHGARNFLPRGELHE